MLLEHGTQPSIGDLLSPTNLTGTGVVHKNVDAPKRSYGLRHNAGRTGGVTYVMFNDK